MQKNGRKIFSLKYDNVMFKRNFLFMKVLFTCCVQLGLLKTIKLSSISGGDFVGGEMVWWQRDWISMCFVVVNELIYSALQQ